MNLVNCISMAQTTGEIYAFAGGAAREVDVAISPSPRKQELHRIIQLVMRRRYQQLSEDTMERLCILVLCVLVPLCRAESPLSPVVSPIACSATEFEAGVALDLINEDRRTGFVFKPLHVVEVHKQEVQSHLYPASTIYYLTIDVLETNCSVLSRRSWKDCSQISSFHLWVFGQCKAIILLSLPWRVQKLLNYNCTTASVPLSVIVQTCPDCPIPTWGIRSETREMAEKLLGDFNKESNSTRHFRLDHIESETFQETECRKTKKNVNLMDCKFLEDKDARVGFCWGWLTTNYYTGEEDKQVTCEVYEPKVDRSPETDYHGPHAFIRGREIQLEGQEKPGAAGKAHDEPHPSQKGKKPDHPPKDSSHKDHSGFSEEHGEKKPSVRKPKGLVQKFRLNDSDVLPAPAITISIPPLPTRPEVRSEFIEFPETDSHLPTCPWTKEDTPEILQYLPRKHNQVSADV
ncbi:MGC69493 protein isoform X2 [Xenopus tropicalis]|uniref:MGC69493 protein isoform X2 n=1 Tax=Xenopus tropicalis TaxID=8364 RepID=A0A8J0SH04_XENTR|nr:MGC69493 protein isoform X2 [Xenopus tropicalis]